MFFQKVTLIEKKDKINSGIWSEDTQLLLQSFNHDDNSEVEISRYDYANFEFHSQHNDDQFILFNEMLKEEEREKYKIDWKKCAEKKGNIAQKITIGNMTYSFRGGFLEIKEDLQKYFPDHKNEIDLFFTMVEKMENATNASLVTKIVSPSILRSFMRNRVAFYYRKYGFYSTNEFISHLTQNKALQAILQSFYLSSYQHVQTSSVPFAHFCHSFLLHSKCHHW